MRFRTLTTGRNTYLLKQFHFHSPSEHTVNGKHFPMEVHFVHQSADGNFAVVGALFEEGPANANLAQLIKWGHTCTIDLSGMCRAYGSGLRSTRCK